MRIGIIGGNGFVGSAFVLYSKKNNFNFEVIEKDTYPRFVGQKFDLIINANGNSKKYLADQNPVLELKETVNSVQNSLLDFDCPFYVLCSTVDVYNNFEDTNSNDENSIIHIESLSKYGLHKFLAERLVMNYAKEWLIFRFGGFVGPGLKKNSIYDILNEVPLRVHIKSSYQYLQTDFAAEAVFKIIDLDLKNEIFNICGKNLISLDEIFQLTNKTSFSYYSSNPSIET